MFRNGRAVFFSLMVVCSLVAGVASGLGYDDEGIVDSGAEVHGHAHHQHGGKDGHPPPSNKNVRLVGKMNVNQDFEGRVSDVGVHGNYAYLGAFWEGDCQKGGVYVFDISNPAAPEQINFIRTALDTYVGEGVQVITLNTPAFKGDLLIHNNETCTNNAGNETVHAVGGIGLVDVTNPKVHKYLANGVGDFENNTTHEVDADAHEVHSAFAWQSGDKAFVVMVDNEEDSDVDIMDITDPRAPRLIAEYDLNTLFPQIVQKDLGTADSFLHDMIVKKIGTRYIMLLSYWDGGYVKLDVTNPLAPKYLADSDFANPDREAAESGLTVKPEGNAHQAEFSLNNDYIVAADEDFDAYKPVAKTDDGTEFTAVTGTDTPVIDKATSIVGTARYVGLACNGDPVVTPGADDIAVIERGVCAFQEKLDNAVTAGYKSIIVFNRQGADACNELVSMIASTSIPSVFVSREVGLSFFDLPYDDAKCKAGTQPTTLPIGERGDGIRIEAIFDGWGYVHLYKNGNGKLTELDTYAIPQAHDPEFASRHGDLSVHEVAMSEKRNDLAYFAYYAGGFRIAKIQNNALVEVGSFIDQGGSNFWGVQVWQKDGKEYVLASDRDYGVYIFEYTDR